MVKSTMHRLAPVVHNTMLFEAVCTRGMSACDHVRNVLQPIRHPPAAARMNSRRVVGTYSMQYMDGLFQGNWASIECL